MAASWYISGWNGYIVHSGVWAWLDLRTAVAGMVSYMMMMGADGSRYNGGEDGCILHNCGKGW